MRTISNAKNVFTHDSLFFLNFHSTSTIVLVRGIPASWIAMVDSSACVPGLHHYCRMLGFYGGVVGKQKPHFHESSMAAGSLNFLTENIFQKRIKDITTSYLLVKITVPI